MPFDRIILLVFVSYTILFFKVIYKKLQNNVILIVFYHSLIFFNLIFENLLRNDISSFNISNALTGDIDSDEYLLCCLSSSVHLSRLWHLPKDVIQPQIVP